MSAKKGKAPPAKQAHLDLGPEFEPRPVPKALKDLGDASLDDVWATLRPAQQAFLAVFLETGNSAEAYRRAYNPTASDHVASVSGSRMMSSAGIETIMAKMNDRRMAAMYAADKVYFDMTTATVPVPVKDKKTGQYKIVGHSPDWKARKDGADGLSRRYGLNAEVNVKLSGKLETKSKVLIVALPEKKGEGSTVAMPAAPKEPGGT
jgi:hypothetical protein